MRTRPCARFASWPTLSIARYLICSNRETKGIALGNNDWAEICTYIDGNHAEYELSRNEWVFIDKLLGLTADRRDPEYLENHLLPALLQALRSAAL